MPGKEDAQALEVTTVLRLISGGSTGAKETKKLVVVGPDHWRYGELDIIQHATTATERREGEIPYRTPKLPATEITYAAGPVADQARTWPADTDLTVLVEIRPVWATGEATLSVTRGSDLLALDATVGAATWHGRFNAGTAPVEAAFPTAPGTSLRRFGGDLAPQVPSPATLSLAPGEGAVAVTSPEAQDHAPGWASFQDLLAAPAR